MLLGSALRIPGAKLSAAFAGNGGSDAASSFDSAIAAGHGRLGSIDGDSALIDSDAASGDWSSGTLLTKSSWFEPGMHITDVDTTSHVPIEADSQIDQHEDDSSSYNSSDNDQVQ